MPEFALSTIATAPVEEVWKLLHDPASFPRWWSGIETVRRDDADAYTIWTDGYPDFPMAQQLHSEHVDGRVTISCLVSDLEYRWQLHESEASTLIEVTVTIPTREAHREETQRALLGESLGRLAALASDAAE
jgi:uncharacterized protein YndB with AHSA1/START domain